MSEPDITKLPPHLARALAGENSVPGSASDPSLVTMPPALARAVSGQNSAPGQGTDPDLTKLPAAFARAVGNPSAPAPTPTLRAVSGNNSVPTATTSANTMVNGRSFHYARETITALTVMIPNFYVNGVDEDVGIGPATITASVEYPIGTRQQFLFGGQPSVVAPAKSVAIPDLLTLSTPIPAGALYKIRWFYSNPNGILFMNNAGPIMYTSPAGNDGVVFGTALTDLTMTGDVASAQGPGGTGAKIMGVLALSTRRAFGVLTDSRGFGQGGTGNSSGDYGELAPSIGDTHGYLNWSIPGHKVGTFITAYNAGTGTIRANLMNQYCTDIVDEGGINDLIIGPTANASTLVTRKIAMRNLFPGKNYYASTVPGANGTSDAERLSYNASILGGAITGAAGIADVANVVMEAPPSAAWKAGYVTGDNIHENATGYAAIKTSGIVKVALGI